MHCMHCAQQCIHKWCKIDAGKQRPQAYAIKKNIREGNCYFSDTILKQLWYCLNDYNCKFWHPKVCVN